MAFRNHLLNGLFFGFALALPMQAQTITTVAGNTSWGRVWQTAIDAAGNIFAVDTDKHVVYKVTPQGVTTVVAGTLGVANYTGDGGQATSATFRNPEGIAVAPDGTLYIADGNNHRIRKIAPNGVISTIAGTGVAGFLGDGGPATSARINLPFTMQLDTKGNLFFVDYNNRRIRKIGTDGNITTVGGSGFAPNISATDGSLATATDMLPGYITIAPDGTIYYSDDGNPSGGVVRVRKISPATGMVTTVAGDGKSGYSGDGLKATLAEFGSVDGLALDSAGDLFIADYGRNYIRKVSADGIISTYAGSGAAGNTGDGGPALMARFNGPAGLTTDGQNNLYVCDISNLRIRKISTAPSIVVNGVVNGASFATGTLVPGEIATVFGVNLTTANGINLASSLPLPTQLLNVQVMVNGNAVPIFAVDNVNGQQQINFQVPYELAGQSSATVQVVDNGSAGNTVTVPVVDAQPGMFTYAVGSTTYGAILHANYQLANTSSPAVGGETVLIYCTGLGAVTPTPADGAAAAGSSQTSAMPGVTIGGVQATIDYSGLAPGYVGLYQINAEVPMGLSSGNQPVLITVNGTQSAIALLPIQ